MPRDFRPELDTALVRLRTLADCIHSTPTTRWRYVPPIIDRDSPDAWTQSDVLGYVKTVQLIEKQLAGLEALSNRRTEIKEDPLPIAMSLETFWKQCLLASSPVTGMKLMMKGKGKEEAFVDVIARGGAEWIKLWTKKDKQLISEFREQDSYVNSDWEDSESDSDSDNYSAGPSTRPVKNGTNGEREILRNSLIDTANSLLAVAATIDRPPGVPSPAVTIRLTRMEEFPADGHDDPRIPATFALLRSKGVELVFGDLEDLELEALSKEPDLWPPLLPSLKINLDPTALVGLCSDILHHPLPSSVEEAKARFFRPPSTPYSRLKGHINGNGTSGGDESDNADQSKNSRELFKELLEEMECPSIESIRDLCTVALEKRRSKGEAVEGVEFWVTEEALRHLREAMCSKEVIGEGMEQRRMRRLIGLESGDFWEGSRYAGHAGVLQDIRLRVFPPPSPGARPICEEGMTTLHIGLADIADQFLTEYATATSPSTLSTLPAQTAAAESALPSFLRPDRLPVPKIVTLSLPFPIVSLQSFARGAREGMTILTMGNVLFREVFHCPRWKLRGWTQGNYEMQSGGGEAHAAVWMLPYRSFAEGKRVRFAAGDYSVPQMAEMI